MNEILLPNARQYAAGRGLDLTESLGSGKDGIVLVAKHKNKPADVAIKILRIEEPYGREKRVYQRLGMAAVTTILGFNVPELIDWLPRSGRLTNELSRGSVEVCHCSKSRFDD